MSQDASFGTSLIDSVLFSTVYQLAGLSTGATYHWRVQGRNDTSSGPFSESFEFSTASSVAVAPSGDLPQTFKLEQNHPNPFNPQTAIRYELAKGGPVQLLVFDMLGRKIQRRVDRYQSAGRYEVTFDAGQLPSGIYLYRLVTGNGSEVATRRMVLLN